MTQEQVESGESFEDRNALGFHVPGRFDKVLNVDKCWLQAEPSNSIRDWVRAYATTNDLAFFDLREQVGFLRNLTIRTSSNGEVMVIFSLYEAQEEARTKMLSAFKEAFPQITSILYVINGKRNDTIGDLEIECFSGRSHIFEEMKAFDSDQVLKFKIGPKSFYQTNSDQAAELYRVTAEFADIKSTETVYDLYTGTGTIANFVAGKAKKVVGVEYVEDAIVDAKLNSATNEIDNTVFYAGDMKDVFTSAFVNENGQPDVIITDPPRAGMHTDVIDVMLKLEAQRIVYVSCNPATQARDLQLLDAKYKVTKVQPVDMFPHTHHVENVVLLELK